MFIPGVSGKSKNPLNPLNALTNPRISLSRKPWNKGKWGNAQSYLWKPLRLTSDVIMRRFVMACQAQLVGAWNILCLCGTEFSLSQQPGIWPRTLLTSDWTLETNLDALGQNWQHLDLQLPVDGRLFKWNTSAAMLLLHSPILMNTHTIEYN